MFNNSDLTLQMQAGYEQIVLQLNGGTHACATPRRVLSVDLSPHHGYGENYQVCAQPWVYNNCSTDLGDNQRCIQREGTYLQRKDSYIRHEAR